MKSSEKAVTIAERLNEIYPERIEFLKFDNNYQLLITVILTAQTTDKQVMKVTPFLFKKYPDPDLLGNADVSDVEEIIKSTGFFKVKARNIIKTALLLSEKYSGKVPQDISELVKLPGVGRKSANVVVGTLFSTPAIIVDTHFKRVVRRLGITTEEHPDKIEFRIRDLIPPDMQYRFSMSVNFHGRKICHARKPECLNCLISGYCDFIQNK
jgi:endonuclease-3